MRKFVALAALAAFVFPALCQQSNKPERLEWFRDLGFGLFIHWSFDSQLGTVISHSMVGASDDYLKRFVEDLPKTYNPRKFNPQEWAVLAKLAGVRYVVFTAKHHSGFCMFKTATTDFNIMNTPFQRDATADILNAFREQGIAAGLYFSPDDFWWLYKNGKTIQRHVPDVQPANNPGLMEHDKSQVKELLSNYGPVDVIFFDGEAQGLRELAWQTNPEIVVTRGAMETPEQYVPGMPLEGAWEACITMGTSWQYQPQNEVYKSGGQLISLLVETRAKGGNLLLNVGPKPDGELPVEQEERLRELALWMFVNSEAIYGVRPWVLTNERDIWFTRRKNEDTLYAVVKDKDWKYGQFREIVLRSVKASPETQVSVLGQNDKILEYRKDVPKTTWKQEADGLHIKAMHAQRLQDNRKWPNPVVLKLTNVKPGLMPPGVLTSGAKWSGGAALLQGELKDMGGASSLEVGFEYRPASGGDTNERSSAWTATALQRKTAPGTFSTSVNFLRAGETYEYRAIVKHAQVTIYGPEKRFTTK